MSYQHQIDDLEDPSHPAPGISRASAAASNILDSVQGFSASQLRVINQSHLRGSVHKIVGELLILAICVAVNMAVASIKIRAGDNVSVVE